MSAGRSLSGAKPTLGRIYEYAPLICLAEILRTVVAGAERNIVLVSLAYKNLSFDPLPAKG
jgi:hypothetical protein